MTLIAICNSCGKKMRAPLALAGKRVRCKCGERIQVPLPNEPTAPVAAARSRAAEPAMDDPIPADLSDLAALSDGEGIEAGRHCPDCFASMTNDAILCTACGYDARTGRKIQIATDPAKAAAQAKADKAAAKEKKAIAAIGDDKPGKFAFLGGLVKPVMILLVIAALLGTAWGFKSAIFFNPREQAKNDHMLITQGMHVDEVVEKLGRRPSSIEAVRPDSMAKDLIQKLTPRKLEYKDKFMDHYTKEDLASGFTFIYIYSQRDHLIIQFMPDGTVESAVKHDPLARLGI